MSWSDGVAISVSIFALALSCVTLWLTEFRRGRLVLSQPTVFYFGWDKTEVDSLPNIMFRAALFSTAARGTVLESLYLRVVNDGNSWVLPSWRYGERSELVKGSGLYVGREGHSGDHHFNLISTDSDFYYGTGLYKIEVWYKRHAKKSTLLGQYEMMLSASNMSADLSDRQSGILWTWDPIALSFHPEARPN
jgi:hypothetical protein